MLHATPEQPLRLSDDSVGDYMDKLGQFELLSAETEVDLAKQIEAGLYARHILEAEDNHELTADYRQALGQVALEGMAARDTMITANTRLAVSIAARYQHMVRHNQFSDIINDANLGLIQAVERFDYTKGVKFSTYAALWIKQAIIKNSYQSERTIRLPRHFHELRSQVNRIRSRHYMQHGTEPTTDAIIQQLQDVTPEDLHQLEYQFSATETTSLNEPVPNNDNQLTLYDIITSQTADETSAVDVAYDQQELHTKLNQLLDDCLSQRDARILRLRLGFHGRPLTMAEIGDGFDISHQAVSQIIKQATKKLAQHPEVAQLRIFLD